mmetsp:Transcript_65002/g.178324  ORF Transcript_65002/g.178324 Transcript_65002/m.178324 type:complete len:198 (-) Transcript_65002:962-1555(-)
MNARLSEAERVLAERDAALGTAVQRLRDFDNLPTDVISIGEAIVAGQLGPFEVTMIKQLLHDNAPNLFPAESTWRAALRDGRRPPLVFAHDSTAVRPYADVRIVDRDTLEVSCFTSGPVRLLTWWLWLPVVGQIVERLRDGSRTWCEPCELQDGERAFVVSSSLLSFVAREITSCASRICLISLPMTCTRFWSIMAA